MVRLTDRPDMTLDVYRGCKTTTQHFSTNILLFIIVCVCVIRALDLQNLGPKFGPIPKAKKYVFFPSSR